MDPQEYIVKVSSHHVYLFWRRVERVELEREKRRQG